MNLQVQPLVIVVVINTCGFFDEKTFPIGLEKYSEG